MKIQLLDLAERNLADGEVRVCSVLDCRRDPQWVEKRLSHG